MRSPKKTSKLNGSVKLARDKFSKVSARKPVRPPRKPTFTSCSIGGASGGPASSNFRSLVCIARYLLAISGEIAACTCSVFTRSIKRWCSCSQRNNISANLSLRALRASCQVENFPPCTQVVFPFIPCSKVTMRLAVFSNSSRSWLTKSTVFLVAPITSSNHRLDGTSK